MNWPRIPIKISAGAVVAALCVFGFLFRPQSSDLVVTPEVLDFGDVQHQQLLNADFVVSNKGREDLSLSDFDVSCGCIGLRIKTASESYEAIPKSLRLPAGQSVTIRAGMAAGSMKGIQAKQIVFKTNLQKRPLVTVNMRANLFGRLHAVPPRVQFDGPSMAAELGQVVLTDGGRKTPFRLDRVEMADQGFDAIAEPVASPKDVDVGGIPLYSVFIRRTDTTPGEYQTRLLVYEVGVDQPVLSIPVSARLRPDWIADPPAIVFPRQGFDQPYAATLKLRNSVVPERIPTKLEVALAPDWLVVEFDHEKTIHFRVDEQVQRDGSQSLLKIAIDGEEAQQSLLEVPVFVIPAQSLQSHVQ